MRRAGNVEGKAGQVRTKQDRTVEGTKGKNRRRKFCPVSADKSPAIDVISTCWVCVCLYIYIYTHTHIYI